MLKTVEVPLSGHPDKVCDQIVEALVDEYLRRDPKSGINLKACGSHGMLMIGGTVDSRADFDAGAVAKKVYREIGYQDELEPFVNIERPSEEEAKTIVNGGSRGTSLVYGYATKETREFLPKVYVYANELAQRIDDLRRHDPSFSFLMPDGKVQITMDGNSFLAVTVSVQHDKQIERNVIQSVLLEHAIIPVLGTQDGVKIYINSAGPFVTGGLQANAGASGRKVLADTYGGLLPHGGAAFCGKDPLRPSRAGALMARYVARKLVEEGVAGNILVTVAYSTGNIEPMFIQATSGTGDDLSTVVQDRFDFRPEAIVELLDLRKPIYQRLATYGYFGREGASWG